MNLITYIATETERQLIETLSKVLMLSHIQPNAQWYCDTLHRKVYAGVETEIMKQPMYRLSGIHRIDVLVNKL